MFFSAADHSWHTVLAANIMPVTSAAQDSTKKLSFSRLCQSFEQKKTLSAFGSIATTEGPPPRPKAELCLNWATSNQQKRLHSSMVVQAHLSQPVRQQSWLHLLRIQNGMQQNNCK